MIHFEEKQKYEELTTRFGARILSYNRKTIVSESMLEKKYC